MAETISSYPRGVPVVAPGEVPEGPFPQARGAGHGRGAGGRPRGRGEQPLWSVAGPDEGTIPAGAVST